MEAVAPILLAHCLSPIHFFFTGHQVSHTRSHLPLGTGVSERSIRVDRVGSMPPVMDREASRVQLTKIFPLGITSFPAHILMHLRPDAEKIGIAFLDRHGRDDREHGRKREEPSEAHRVWVNGEGQPNGTRYRQMEWHF
jgi:hypothetical protein